LTRRNKYFAVIVAEFDEINNCTLRNGQWRSAIPSEYPKVINGLSAAARRRAADPQMRARPIPGAHLDAADVITFYRRRRARITFRTSADPRGGSSRARALTLLWIAWDAVLVAFRAPPPRRACPV
jgi:hypothetical protein